MESYRKNSEKYLKIDLLLKEIDNLENVLEKKLNSNTKKVDPNFKGNYLCGERPLKPNQKINSILITSLGFGGINAALTLKKWS